MSCDEWTGGAEWQPVTWVGGGAGAADEEYREDVVRFARERLGFEPDAQQEQVLRGGKRVMLCCSRQWGKTTVTAIKALHTAYFDPAALVLIGSPSLRQSTLFLRAVRGLAARLGLGKLRGDGENRPSLQLPGGGRIVGLPGNADTTVGFSNVTLLIFDEAARVPDEMFESLAPVLAVSGGGLWAISTPKGKRGFFWRIWARGDGDWMRIEAPATACARIPASFLEAARRDLPERRFRQEFLCEFLEPDGALFSAAAMSRAFHDDIPRLELW
ncbi:MAG TPA: hypothetical protein DEH78_29405 [Solibacterales bacterium]|nr:hypothetical protein [Bryobacterales bacterium]